MGYPIQQPPRTGVDDKIGWRWTLLLIAVVIMIICGFIAGGNWLVYTVTEFFSLQAGADPWATWTFYGWGPIAGTILGIVAAFGFAILLSLGTGRAHARLM